MKIPKGEFFRSMWCPKCFEMRIHEVLHLMRIFRGNNFYHRYSQRCTKCNRSEKTESLEKDFIALIDNKYE